MPARAPKPGVGRRIAISEELAAGREDWRRVVCERDGVDVTVRASSIGAEDEMVFEKETSFPLWSVWNDPSGVARLLALYWLARRKNGERDLRFKRVVRAFPDIESVRDAGFDIWIPDPDEDDSEGDGVDPTSPGTGSEPAGPS